MSALINNPVLAAFVAFFIYSASNASLHPLPFRHHRAGWAASAGPIITALWYLTPKRLISPLALEQLERGGNIWWARAACC